MSQIPKNCSGIPLHDGKVGLDEPCCCNECRCDCECTLNVTIDGVTLPANGLSYVLCVTDTAGNANARWYPQIPGEAVMTIARVILECFGECGVYQATLFTQYLQIDKLPNGDLPAVGAQYVMESWPMYLITIETERRYAFPSCNECGCPTGIFKKTTIFSFDPPDKPCLAQLGSATWDDPVFEFDCEACP
jgi:hypothetical protein